MLNDFTGADQVYIACGYTDLRKGIDNEDIGFVITENGLPDMVLIPFRWFAENFPDEVPDGL